MNDYQQYIHQSRYARYLDEQQRRETWEETVTRYIDYLKEKFPKHDKLLEKDIKSAILELEIMPSMRSLMTAGHALERDNISGYNCSYLAFDHPRAFSELLYILMCGTGVGFSVERQYVNQLSAVADELYDTDTVINVRDSKLGWATGFHELITLLYSGKVPKWDLSRLRPAGARLKTFGGRSSGPAPLNDLFEFCVQIFKRAAGRKLNSLEVHDIACKTGEIVVVGGVRRSALISLSNLSDDRMRGAKSGQWWEDNVQRALANNSAAYTERPDTGIFMKEWLSLYESKSGERGIFNRVAAQKQARKNGRREDAEFGTNPCGEIILRSNQFCNLTEAIVRPDDTLKDLKDKVYLATVLGTFQSTFTDFKYIRNTWKKNCEEERLLGVSLTGIMDHVVMNGMNDVQETTRYLKAMRDHTVKTNVEIADELKIAHSTAITCIKPSGTVSQLVDSSSGIHPRYSQYYIRTVRNDKKDPLFAFMRDQGVPYEDDVTKPESTAVFSFPIKSPAHAVLNSDMTAIQQLEVYKLYKEHWCEHNPSITVYIEEDEWLNVGNWVYKNWDSIGGVAFLPHSDHVYKQAPYQPISKADFDAATKAMKPIEWSKFSETDDNTIASQEPACMGGGCEI